MEKLNVNVLMQKNNWYSPTHTGTYYLETDLYVENGAKLSIDGSEKDRNECETLFLASNSSTIVNLRAYGGYLDIRYTEIVSWDLANGDHDLLPESNGRRCLFIWHLLVFGLNIWPPRLTLYLVRMCY